MENEYEITGPQPGPQWDFCASTADIAIGGGSFFGGKTISLVMMAGNCADDESYRAAIFRRTSVQITDSGGLSDVATRVYPQLNGFPTERKTLWTFPSGAQIKFNHLEHDSDIVNYRSSQFCFLGIDQLEEFPESAFWYLRARNRPSTGYKKRCVFRATCNPEPGWLSNMLSWWIDQETGYPIKERSGVVRHFVRRGNRIEWVKPDYYYVDKGVEIRPTSFTFVPSTAKDNKIGLQNDPNYQSNIANMDAVSVERYLHGNWKASYSGGMFNPRDFIKIKEHELPAGIKWLRYWDFAASEVKEGRDPDWTSGGKVGLLGEKIYIRDINRFRETPGKIERNMVDTAKHDTTSTSIRWEEEKGSAGKFNSYHLVGKLIGYDAKPDPVKGEKVERAKPLASSVEQGRVYIVEGPWNDEFLAEAGSFPRKKKDQIDCVTGALKCLTQEKSVWNFNASNAVKIKIDWSRSIPTNKQYIGMWLSQNGQLYVLATVWDEIKGECYIYWAHNFLDVIPDILARELITNCNLKLVQTSILGNDDLLGDGKSPAKLIKNAFRAYKSYRLTVRTPVNYDEKGSIIYASSLFELDKIFVSLDCPDVVSQFSSWQYKENGKPAPEFGYEYCMALCLIMSEVKRTIVHPKDRVKYQDYSRKSVDKPKETSSWQIV